MSRKTFVQISVLTIFIAALILVPGHAAAGGVCGGTYIVDPGDTFSKIASKCGTSVSAITSANPGVNEPLSTGQTLTVPGITYNTTPTPVPANNSTTTYNTYNTYNYYNTAPGNTYPPASYSSTYVVQYGDTFSAIAYSYGVSVNDLWAANSYIVDINYLYAGQILYVPYSSNGYIPAPTEESVPLSYGSVPFNVPKGKIALSNKANGDVYVSLQGTTGDVIHFINEYLVSGQMQVKLPSGSYTYVAWVGGIKFEGWFQLGKDGSRTITFYAKKVVVE